MFRLLTFNDYNFGINSNFSLPPMSTSNRLGRIHRKEDIQPLKETLGKWSVEDVLKRGQGGFQISTEPATEDNGHGLLGCKGQEKNE